MEEKQQKKITQLDMTTRPLFGKILVFALPLVFTGILQLLYNATDIIVLGHFASDASAGAVGSTGALINLITTLFIGMSIGASSIAAMYIGAGNKEKLSKVVHTSMVLSVIFGFAIGIPCVCLTKYFLIAMNVPDSILPLSTLYLQIYFGGLPFSFVYNFGSALLRAQGDTKHPLLFLFSAGIINVSLNLILVIVAKMDVAGVGTATIIAQFLSALFVTIYLIKQNGPCKVYVKKLKIDLPILKEIIKVGLPAGLEGTIFSISNVIIQSAFNSFGEIAIAANAYAWNVEGFIYISMNAIAQSCLTFTSQNYGACKTKNMDISLVNSIIIAMSIGLVAGLAVYFASDYLLLIFTKNTEAIAYAKERLSIVATTYCLCGAMDVLASSQRGMGHSLTPMLISLVGACLFRIIYIYTIFQVHHSLFVLYLAYPISWIITICAHIVSLLIIRHKEYKKINSFVSNEKESLANSETK